MRGTAVSGKADTHNCRITPAHAGNRWHNRQRAAINQDHPRSCGEQSSSMVGSPPPVGSPPLMRGTVAYTAVPTSHFGITPAHAGNSGQNVLDKSFKQDHPRSCGEQILIAILMLVILGSPPLMRGTGGKSGDTGRRLRITPAHAGNSLISPLFIFHV